MSSAHTSLATANRAPTDVVDPRTNVPSTPDLAEVDQMLGRLMEVARTPKGDTPASHLEKFHNGLTVTVREQLNKGGTARTEQLRALLDSTLMDNVAISQIIQLAMQQPGSLTEQLALIERYLPLKQVADTQVIDIIRTMHSLERPVAVGIRANQINVGAAQVNVARGENDGMPVFGKNTPTSDSVE